MSQSNLALTVEAKKNAQDHQGGINGGLRDGGRWGLLEHMGQGEGMGKQYGTPVWEGGRGNSTK